MAQFVSGVGILQQKEVSSAVRYLMLVVSSRLSLSIFVSFSNHLYLLCAISKLMLSIVFFTCIANSLTATSVAISPSGSTTAGETYSLTCLATLNSRNPPLQDLNIPSPTFEWFFGPNGNAPLPSGLIPMATVLSGLTYTSTLQFSPLTQSLHTGNYTCRLGAASLVNSAMVTVNGMLIVR